MLEDVFETAIVLFHNGVFGGEIEGVVSFQGVLETLMGKLRDRGVQVVHGHPDPGGREIEDLVLLDRVS
jgi:hypothetical protein